MAVMTSNLPQPIYNSNADRGIFGGLIDKTAQGVADEDFMRDLQKMAYTNEFNANEVEKNRQWQERLSNTAYQRAVADMKKAGINPIMGLGMANQASTPTGGAASGSTSSSRGNTGQDNGLLSFLGVIGNIILGAYTNGANNAVKQSISNAKNANNLAVANVTRKSESYNQNWNYSFGNNKRKK